MTNCRAVEPTSSRPSGPLTTVDQFFTILHYGHLKIDAAAFLLPICALVDKPLTFTVDELRKEGVQKVGLQVQTGQ